MSNCEDDFELENLRLAALKSMQSKAPIKPVINNKNNLNDATNFTTNSNNVQIQIDRPITDRTFVNKKPIRKNFPKPPNHQQQFNHPPQFNNHQFTNQPAKFQQPTINPPQFNNQSPAQPFISNNSNQSGFTNDLQQYFNQFNNEQQFSNNVPQKFHKNNNNPQFNQSITLNNQTPQQFKNNNQQPPLISHAHHHHPQQFTPSQFNGPPPPQFNQPRSNLIVLTAQSNEPNTNEHHRTPNYQSQNHHQMNLRFRNGCNKPMNRDRNKKFHNNQSKSTDNSNEKTSQDSATDTNKNADSLPSRFSRIDRESSSDEDEEFESDDSNIEKYRQTYFVANEDIRNDTDQQSEA